MTEVQTWTATFTYPCRTCGVTVQVIEGRQQPHRCRIDLDAQKGTSA